MPSDENYRWLGATQPARRDPVVELEAASTYQLEMATMTSMAAGVFEEPSCGRVEQQTGHLPMSD